MESPGDRGTEADPSLVSPMHMTLPREIHCGCGRVRVESELQKMLTGASKLNRDVHHYFSSKADNKVFMLCCKSFIQ